MLHQHQQQHRMPARAVELLSPRKVSRRLCGSSRKLLEFVGNTWRACSRRTQSRRPPAFGLRLRRIRTVRGGFHGAKHQL